MKSAPKTHAWINHGRWIANCPSCGQPAQVEPSADAHLFCRLCYPETYAVHFVPNAYGGFDPVPNDALRREYRAKMLADNIAPQVIYPDNRREIMEILRPRPLENMNWELHETADDLRAENIEHGIEAVN